MNQMSFRDNFINNRLCRGIRSKEITLKYRVNLDLNGKVKAVNFEGDLAAMSRGHKSIEKITREALFKTSFSPETIEGIPLASELLVAPTLGKNACLAR